MSFPCLNAFNGSHFLQLKSKLFINMAHRPFMTWPNLSPINPNHALDTVIILHVPSIWHAFSHLKGFCLCCYCNLGSTVHVCSPVNLTFILPDPLKQHFLQAFSEHQAVLNIPTLCFLSTLCILYHVMLKLSIYLSGILTSSVRAQTMWAHTAVMGSMFYLIQSLYYFEYLGNYFLCNCYVSLVRLEAH